MRAKNTFEGGVVFGIDPVKQAPNTMRYALNGRLIYNPNIPHGSSALNDEEDGSTFFAESLQGRTLAFCNERGTKDILTTCTGYEIVAMIDLGYAAIVISTTGSTGYGQIGMFKMNSDLSGVTYQVLYDDHNDPFQDRLRIKKSNEPGAIALDVDYVDENTYKKRIYFSDGFNQERALNLQLMFQQTRCAEPCETIENLTPIHTPVSQNCHQSSVTYPKHLSVHSMDSRMDLVFPRKKFVTRIDGSLKRGAYQYAMRYISADGHKSVWSTITRHILVTGTHFPQNPEYLHPVLSAPWNGNNGFTHHNRVMSSTDNDSVTEDGLQLQFTGLDTRWDSFEVAYIYSKTDTVSHEANVFYTYNSNCGTTPFSGTVIINHVNHTGYPVAFPEFNQRYETILSAKSTRDYNNKLYKLGVELLPYIEANFALTTIKPCFKYLQPDQTLEPNFMAKPNPRTGGQDGDPLTNAVPVNTTIQLSNFTGSIESYTVNDDYLSYKGQQAEHLLTSYWRGETYGIALVFRDRKGNPLFAQHIKDYTFPEQYHVDSSGEPCSLTKLVNGKWELRVMGMRISHIRIPKACLRDKFGKLNVSSFEIVRTKRNKRILHQGIIYPVVNVGVGCGSGDDAYQPYIRNKPSPFLKNKYELEFSEQGDFHSITPDAQGNSHYMIRDDNNGSIFSKRDTIGERVVAYPGYCMYASPDVMFSGSYEFRDTDKIRHVGTGHKAYTQNEIPLVGSGFPTKNINKHNYCKCYNTVNQEGNLDLLRYGRPRIGTDSELKFGRLMRDSWYEEKGIDPDRTDMTFRNGYLDVAIADQNAFDAPGSGTTTHKIAAGAGVRNTLFLGCRGYKHVDIHDETSEVSYRIANYIRANADYVTANGDDSFDARAYQSTGHFQPITEAILTAADEDADFYIFSDVDVFGGDCFPGFFGFTRSMAQGKFDCGDQDAAVRFKGDLEVTSCNNTNGDESIGYKDYSYSMIVPLESELNYALRTGRIFEAVGTMPQETYCENNFLQFSGGINDKQQESFDINRVLLHQENIQFFGVKPDNLVIVTSKPTSVYVSDQKTMSELDDAYRRQKVNNFYDLEEPGDGVALVKLFSYLYVFQKHAYGILRTNERAIVPTNIGEVVLGTGKDLDGVDYLSREIGTQHKSSVLAFDNAVYWVDAKRGLICRHAQSGREEISESQMTHDFVSKALDYFDNNLPALINTGDRNIVAGTNPETRDVFFTFHGEQVTSGPPKSNITKTLGFSEKLNVFHGFYQMYPSLYFSFGKMLLLVNSNQRNNIHVHNRGLYGHYFGQFRKTVFVFYMNDAPDYEKILDYIKIQVDMQGQRRIGKVTINSQTSQHNLYYQQNNLFFDERFKYREDSLVLPAFQTGLRLPRLRDKFFTVRVEIDNANQLIDNQDIPVSISAIYSEYRPSFKL